MAWRKGNRGQGRDRRGEKSGPTFSLHLVSFSAAVCNIQYWGIKYRRTGFNCENLIIVNCEFF